MKYKTAELAITAVVIWIFLFLILAIIGNTTIAVTLLHWSAYALFFLFTLAATLALITQSRI